MKIIAAALIAASLGTAAFAQMAASDPMAGVPAADKTKITKCMAMNHDAMMKSAMCMKMMKLYPAAFSGSVSSN